MKNGKFEIEMPENVVDGEARVEVPVMADEQVHEDIPLSPEEIREFLNFKGLPLGEIETGGWEDMGIEDSVEFVQALRRRTWRKSDLE